MRYARAELEGLRGAPSEEAQARRRAEVYAALALAGFSGEYARLLAAEEPINRKGKKVSGGGCAGGGRRKAEAAAPRFLEVTELGAWRNGDLGVVHHEHCVEAVHDPSGVHQVIGELFDQCESVEYDDDSDDDYDGILKPAFVVDGDPDFDSGEPLDGFEYLRRVRLTWGYA